MAEQRRFPFDVEKVLFLGELDELKFEFGILRPEHAQECGYGVGANCTNGGFSLLIRFIGWIQPTTRGVLLAPIAQWFSLINRFAGLAEDQPRDKTKNGEQQRDQQVTACLPHGGSMHNTQRKSESLLTSAATGKDLGRAAAASLPLNNGG